MKKGDRIFFYHTGNEKSVIGICRAAGDAYADPADKTGKLYAVDVEPVKKLKSPVTLAAIKADTRFADVRADSRAAAVGDAGVGGRVEDGLWRWELSGCVKRHGARST